MKNENELVLKKKMAVAATFLNRRYRKLSKLDKYFYTTTEIPNTVAKSPIMT